MQSVNQRARGLQDFESLPPFCELYHEQGSGNWDVAAATPRGCARLQGAAAALKGRVCESWARRIHRRDGQRCVRGAELRHVHRLFLSM